MLLEFGTTFKKIRTDKNLSQADVAKNVMTRSYYSKIESNTNIPTIDKFYGLLENLEISPEEFSYIHNHYALTKKDRLFQSIRQGIQAENSQQIWEGTRADARQAFETSQDATYNHLRIISEYLLANYHDKPQNKADIQVIKDYLFDCNHFYIHDLFFFNIIISEYSVEAIESMVDRLLKNVYEYAHFPNYGSDTLTVLMNLTYFFYRHNKPENGDFFLTLLEARKKKTTRMYERIGITFLEGISQVVAGDTVQGEATCHRCIALLEELQLSHAVLDFNRRLTTIQSLTKTPANKN